MLYKMLFILSGFDFYRVEYMEVPTTLCSSSKTEPWAPAPSLVRSLALFDPVSTCPILETSSLGNYKTISMDISYTFVVTQQPFVIGSICTGHCFWLIFIQSCCASMFLCLTFTSEVCLSPPPGNFHRDQECFTY